MINVINGQLYFTPFNWFRLILSIFGSCNIRYIDQRSGVTYYINVPTKSKWKTLITISIPLRLSIFSISNIALLHTKMTLSCLQVLHDCSPFARLCNSFDCREVWKDVGQSQFYCRSSNAVFQREYILNENYIVIL